MCAIKMLKSTSSDDRVKFLQEAAIMAQFSHSNICQLHGLVADSDPTMLVLELLPHGSLYTWLRAHSASQGPIDQTLSIKIALDVASAMKYLHSLSFVHRGWIPASPALGRF